MNDKQNKQNVKEGVSGAIPMVSFASELGGVVFLAATFIIPAVFHALKMELTKDQLTSHAKALVKAVKENVSKEPFNKKISRATNDIIQKITGGSANAQVIEQIANKTLETNKELKAKLTGLKNPNSGRGMRL